jgi:hypothetical protein
MSKLTILKEWLTVPDAAKYLSKKLNEEVSEADLLQFALTGRLTLSVYFVNSMMARAGKIVSAEEARKTLMPRLDDPNEMIEITHGPQLNTGEVVELEEKEMVKLVGVWDLPMIGGEQNDVERAYMEKVDGPEITTTYIDGNFVSTPDGHLFQLLHRFDDAYVKSMETKYKREWNDIDNYYPGDALPEDSLLVVRSGALVDFENALNDNLEKEEPSKKPAISKLKKFEHLTEQREEYREEAYELLSEKVIDKYRAGAMQHHHIAAKAIYDTYKRNDYDQEITEALGGVPRRALSYNRLKEEVVKKMRLEGFGEWIFGQKKT